MRELGFGRTDSGELLPPDASKEGYRALHSQHWAQRLQSNSELIDRCWLEFEQHFAAGKQIDPANIRPRLELVHGGTWQSDLFRVASLTWSVPVSNGYGRRLRFLIWDDSNAKLLGLIALTDPVFNLRARDSLIGWDSDDRRKRLIHMMDAHVLGAIPPYNQLLCGKLVACLVRSIEVRDVFQDKYGDSKGIISKKKKRPKLLAVTTTSSLGRSSIFNRLKLDGTRYFEPIGFTSGYGHFHIPQDLFEEMRGYLTENDHPYSSGHRFGMGPNWRLRTIRVCLAALGLNQDILCHTLKREVFLCSLASNAAKILSGEQSHANWRSLLTVSAIAEKAIARWIVPRAERRPEFAHWTVADTALQIRNGHPPAPAQITRGEKKRG